MPPVTTRLRGRGVVRERERERVTETTVTVSQDQDGPKTSQIPRGDIHRDRDCGIPSSGLCLAIAGVEYPARECPHGLE